MLLKKFLEYLDPRNWFRSNKAQGFDLRAMHTINKISIAVFLGCVIVLIWRVFNR